MKKRLIAFLLVLIMVLGMLPVSALAADGDATKNTYHLIHEFNYVGGSRWDIEATTAAESYQIDVNTGKPTRDRYKFDGWADEANATTATYFGGELITLTKDNPTKIIYAVWKPIFELHYNANGGTGAPDSQTYTSYSATSTQATFTVPNQTPTKEGYTFKGWADSAAATTAQYQPGGTIPVKHENSPKTVYAVWEKNDSPVPDNPGGTKPDVANAQVKICVQCIEDSATHQPKNYGILPGAYVDGLLQVDGTYYYSITLNRAKYIEKFDQDSGKTHTDTEPNESIQFKWQWKNGKWELISDIAPVIKCQCEKQVEEKYTVTYTDGVDGKFFEDVVFSDLKSGVATPAFGKDPYHPGYTFAGWEPVVAATVTETVTYVAKWTPVEPKAPTADELKKLEMAVQVKCVVDDSQQHTAAYDLLGEYDEDYFVGEPRKDGDDWLCDINYYPERYVAEFNTTFQNLKHVQNDEKIVPVTLIWDGGSWQLKTQGRVHVTEEYTVTYTDGVDGEEVFADQVYSDLRKDSTTPAFNGTPTRTGYTFAGWEPEVAATVTQTVTYVAKWEKKTYKVVAKLYVNGKPAYYQNEDFYTYEVSGLYGEAIDFDTIKAKAVEQAKQIKKASASYTAVILEDHEPNPVCTTFGEHQPGQATHYVKVNVKTEENVVIFQSFEGKTDLTKLHTTTAPYGTNVVEFLNGLGLDLDVAGYTLDTDEDGNTNWYKKDSPKWTFGANDTINGWTNVLLKYTVTPHNIYAYARLNSYFAPLTTSEFDTPVTLNEATLSRLGLGSYNSATFLSAALPSMQCR